MQEANSDLICFSSENVITTVDFLFIILPVKEKNIHLQGNFFEEKREIFNGF